MTIFDDLRKPFPPNRVSWRVGATKDGRGLALAYIDARDVMERLDEVCGPDGWQCRYPHANSKTVCEIGIRFEADWIWKANGAGDTDVEAEKGALSDAFKRAAVCWGIGRYLYDIDSVWVEIEERGRSKIIKQSEYAKLERLLGNKTAAAPPTAPADNQALDSLAIANDCIREIKEIFADPAKGPLDLQKWLKTKNLESLSEADYTRVKETYKASKEEMKGRVAA